jgi:hypothetical protein
VRSEQVFRMPYESLDFANRTILLAPRKTRNAKRTRSMCQEVLERYRGEEMQETQKKKGSTPERWRA